MVMCAIDNDGLFWGNPLQSEPLILLIGIQMLRYDFRLGITDVVKIVLYEDVYALLVALRHTMYVAILFYGRRNNYKTGLFVGFTNEGLFVGLSLFYSATWKLVVVVFEAVDHSNPAVLDYDCTDRRAGEYMFSAGVILCIQIE